MNPADEYSSAGDLLAALIRIPSVNPEGDPGTGPENTGEEKIATAVSRILEGIGAQVRFDEVEPGRPNVVGTFPGGDGKPAVLLGPHLDTVGVGAMSIDPFGGERHGGKIYGRGACDTKGTMAAMLWALKELGPERISALDIGVSFAGFMGEETGQPGSRHFARKHAGKYAFALVGEPTRCQIVHKHKGTLWLEISAAGKSAHGSTPERGENAIVKMAELVTLLEEKFSRELSRDLYRDKTLGHPTINIGRIHGGTRTNIVPENCSISVDLRVTPALDPEKALTLVRDFMEQHGGGKVTVQAGLSCQPLDTPSENKFVQRLLALPCSPELAGAPWFCDAAVLAGEGDIPSVAAGPGDIAQAHTADEWIEEEELERGVAFYRQFLEGRARSAQGEKLPTGP
jgi:acetylornithine deacetylase